MRKIFFTCMAAVITSLSYAQPVTVNGWTVFTPSSDSRIIYVSDSEGDDGTGTIYSPSSAAVGSDVFNPSGPVMPYRTISAAISHVRFGYPDYILFKRGDSWTGQSFGVVHFSGRSANEPMVIGSYGVGSRPMILTGNTAGIVFNNFSGTEMTNHVALTDLHFQPHERVDDSEINGVTIWQQFSDVLIENCVITKYHHNFVCHGNDVTYQTEIRESLRFRRCIISEAYTTGTGHANAFFIDHVNGILMEECLLDHNGWNEDVTGADPTMFRHNSYFQVHNSNLVFRKNIVARASAVGGSLRCGGIMEDNLFLSNVSNIVYGTAEPTIDWPAESVTGKVEGNVVLETRPESYDEGQGLRIHKARNVEVYNNIVAHQLYQAMYTSAIEVSAGYENINLYDNIVYNWGRNLPFGPSTSYTTNSGLSLGSGAVGTNMIRRNHIQQISPGSGCVQVGSEFSSFSFEGNSYFSPETNNAFEEGAMNYSQWLSASGETGSSFSQLDYKDPNRFISTYMSSLGSPGTLDDFLYQASLQEKQNWRVEYSVQPVLCYIRQGFVLPMYATKSEDTTIIQGTTASFNIHGLPASSYSISFNGGSFEQQSSFQVSPTTTTVYQIAVIDSSQLWLMCEPETIEWTVIVDAVTAKQPAFHDQISVFPNPSVGDLYIRTTGFAFDQAIIQIKDLTGRLVYESKISGKSGMINTQGLEGLFIVEIEDPNGKFRQKVVFK